MSSLPPYSTFRTDTRQQQLMYPQAISSGNVLTFTPPGFKQSLNVKFPDSRLAVCEACKKNFKTRDMCRVRNQHVAAPWTTAYICMTLDETCTDEHGRYVDKPFVARMVQWQPFCVRDELGPKTPVCSSCKKTNRTRSFCRERHRHRHLPWCTVYVLLSTEETADPDTIVAAPSAPVNGGDGSEAHDEGKAPGSPVGVQDEASTAESKTSDSLDGVTSENVSPADEGKRMSDQETGDDINAIAESRTMLVQVSARSTYITWVELAESDDSSVSGVSGVNPGAAALTDHAQYNPYGSTAHSSVGVSASAGIDPNMGYHYPIGYGQPQSALKTQQQQQQYFYQLQQQRHPYPAPQSPWQYTHQPPPQGYGHALPPPHTPQQSPASPVSDETPAPTPVTAGEAAAQRQKKLSQAAEGNRDGHSPTPPPPPPGMGHYQHYPPAATVAQVSPMVGTELQSHTHPHHQQQQQQQQQQHIPWTMYQQMYQAQQIPPALGMHPHPTNLHAPVVPGSETTSPDQHNSVSSHGGDIPPQEVNSVYSSAEGNGRTLQHSQQRHGVEDDNESDTKRQRFA